MVFQKQWSGIKNLEKGKVQNNKKNNNFKKAYDSRPKPYFSEIINDDKIAAPRVIKESSNNFLGDFDIKRDRYFSSEFVCLEEKKIWNKVWQFACREEDIPSVGDYYVYDILDWSILIVRSEKNKINAFINSCLHRGTQIKPSNSCGYSESLRCPFHGWEWQLNGDLDKIPCDWDFPHINKDKANLYKVKVDTWGGFVFINLDNNSIPLQEYLSVIPEHFRDWDMSNRRKAAHVAKIIPCNWKFAVEAFLEGYHVKETHPQALPYTGDTNCQYDYWGDHISRMMSGLGTPSPNLDLNNISDKDTIESMRDLVSYLDGDLDENIKQIKPREFLAKSMRDILTKSTGVDHSEFSTSEIIDAIQYFVFPNFIPWAGYGVPIVYRFRPNGHDPDSSIFEVILLYESSDKNFESDPNINWLEPDDSWTKAEELGGLGILFDQDEAAFKAGQNGLKASLKKGSTFSLYQESRIRHFHKTIDNYIAQN